MIIALLSFSITLAVIAYVENTDASWLNAVDAIIAVGLGTTLFIMILRQRLNINSAFTILVLFSIGYSFLRNWIFAPTLSVISQQMTPLYESYMQRFPALKFNKDSVAWIQNFMQVYQPAIWGSIQTSAVFLGFLLFNRTSLLKQQIRMIQFPYYLVFLMMIALALSLNHATRTWGINLLVCMSVAYLIQGTAVMSFVWGDFFAKAKLLRTFLIMTIIINYPVLILISLIGLLDVWFDFRKLTFKEEKHESDIN